MSEQKQADGPCRPPSKTWQQWRESSHATYNGGHEGKCHDAFHHGMDTVFNMLEGEMPSMAKCEAADALLTACREVRTTAIPSDNGMVLIPASVLASVKDAIGENAVRVIAEGE